MKVYRGDAIANFEILKSKKSRYGISALFFTSSCELAKLYARSYNKLSGGALYSFELKNESLSKIDFGGKLSYNSKFRELIFKLYREGHKGVLIKNVYDYPSKKMFQLIKSDIYFKIKNNIVVFDFKIIESFDLIDKNILF